MYNRSYHKNSFLGRKEFLLQVIDYHFGNLELIVLFESFKKLLQYLEMKYEDIIYTMKKKNKERGSFEKRMVMEYVLVSIGGPLAKKYFLSTNNIYSGLYTIGNTSYHKFITNKAIRDHIPRLYLMTNEGGSYNLKEEEAIGKVFIASPQLFKEYLKNKLVEETKEMLYSKTPQELKEELGDILGVFLSLDFMYEDDHEYTQR